MKPFVWLAALAAAVASAPGAAQHDGSPMAQAAADYGLCVYRSARAAEQGGVSVEASIAAGFSTCKRERKRVLSETRARLAAGGLAGASAKTTAENMIASGDRGMADSLRQEFEKKRGVGASPQ
jgi:hypothetical protein